MKVLHTERIPIKMWLNDLEEGALNQARDLANTFYTQKWVSIMPDSHQGYGMPIGGVVATSDVISPNLVGVDIGCGMSASKLHINFISDKDLLKAMNEIKASIPVGFNNHGFRQYWKGFEDAPDIEIIQDELDNSKFQLGTLGGGNHFIEIQKGDDGHIWLMIHSGSRGLGYKVANYYHSEAKHMCERWNSDLPNMDLAFLPMDSKLGVEYYNAMKFCMEYAKANRKLMMTRAKSAISLITGAVELDSIDIHHNYAQAEHHYGKMYLIHRKGATKASEGLRGIIPGSMGTKSYVVEGLGNPESFESCSHGAGRAMGRKEAKRTLNLDKVLEKMKGVMHDIRTVEDLDEAPDAYKDINVVMENQKDLTKVLVELTPLGVVKG